MEYLRFEIDKIGKQLTIRNIDKINKLLNKDVSIIINR